MTKNTYYVKIISRYNKEVVLLRILIVGIGKLGEYLARSLVKDGNAVTLVDIDFSMNKDLINNEDVNYICGNGMDINVLIDAGVKETDLLISVMESDEQNVFCCLLGKKLGVAHTIARIRKPEFTNSVNLIKEELGLSMVINPDLLTANQIAEALSIPSALETSIFLKGRIRMISLKVKENSPLLNVVINSLFPNSLKESSIFTISNNTISSLPTLFAG